MQQIRKNTIRKGLFFMLGTACLVLAYLGIILPGFPGTPFILLTAFFYLRSSERMFGWLMRRKLFAKMIGEFEKNPHLPLRLKIYVLIPFWISIPVAELFFVKGIYAHLAVIAILLVVTIFVLRLKKINLRVNSQKVLINDSEGKKLLL